ncbi:hypothetical protein BDV96DRAFT_593415 [Lophiotrema nucula]|uniref:Uncharacterized protein n=1 Tax=Lophiotrema nucula TaxID=690887 RepID=A0A6A5ZT92_9PLEO|nr:hypothetical protein BDV96DRAFT_593415 [Lophiotrema nucula]
MWPSWLANPFESVFLQAPGPRCSERTQEARMCRPDRRQTLRRVLVAGLIIRPSFLFRKPDPTSEVEAQAVMDGWVEFSDASFLNELPREADQSHHLTPDLLSSYSPFESGVTSRRPATSTRISLSQSLPSGASADPEASVNWRHLRLSGWKLDSSMVNCPNRVLWYDE